MSYGFSDSWRWPGFNFADSRIDIFVANREVVWSAATFNSGSCDCLETVDVVVADSRIALAHNVNAEVSLHLTAVSSPGVLGLSDEARVGRFILPWARSDRVILVEALYLVGELRRSLLLLNLVGLLEERLV